ncbi:DNA adenine methylase [Iningainema tapete]|uniref:Site-specific DNA-methyltransferase (adenine-specific) n=1 Tax=Iningainema tapete BLCC-T55 TaxID=2748662 RepID=A0A8J6XTI6_9CYAN|nr:DNA adenine methylase [Iningainema tapete]MBD2777985.1 DNA adenine methylase [Iningainema tapete BLCC-T55]
MPRPFLKWAGGKGQLIEQISKFFPKELLDGSIKRYIEPFIGGGAVFFHFADNYPSIEEFYIFDINPELILAYKTIQNHAEELGELLQKIQNKYWSLNPEERSKYFYQVRTYFNQQRLQTDFENYSDSWVERTAQIIFLNRTCFNGLFRVNLKGDFNVPFGKYKNPTICDLNNLMAVSALLKKTQIFHGDFTLSQEFVDSKTFVYFDPPYRPISKTSNFTSYSQGSFDDTDQLRLRNFFSELNSLGAKLLLSNSDPKNVDEDDIFFETNYAKYRIEKIKAFRNINSKAEKRGQINELLIMNY